MDKVYSVTLISLEDINPYKTWLFNNKKDAYIFMCNKYGKLWDKNMDYIINEKSKYPFVDGYKNTDFSIGEYYNIYFENNTEIIFGMCQITSAHIKTNDSNISKDYYSNIGEDLQEAFEIAEQMIENPDDVTFGDMIWLCKNVGMGREILNAKEGTWLNIVENALRKLGFRI